MKQFNPLSFVTAALLLVISLGLPACGGSSEAVAPTFIDNPITVPSQPVPTDKSVTVAKQLSPQSNDTIGSGQREVDSLKKAGVNVKTEICACRVFTDRLFIRTPVFLLAEISANDALKALQLGYELASEESLKVDFRNPFACASLLY